MTIPEPASHALQELGIATLLSVLRTSTTKPLPLLHYVLAYLDPLDILHVSQLHHALHADRRLAPSGELWWWRTFHVDAPPARGMRTAERRRDWRRACFEKHDELERIAAKDDMKSRAAAWAAAHPKGKKSEIMEPSPMEYGMPAGSRGKLTTEEKVEARAYYKELKNKKAKGKLVEKVSREERFIYY